MKSFQCYELHGGIAHKNHAFFINMHSKNINEIWKKIKTITYENRQTISISIFRNFDGTPIGERDIAYAFNNFFTNIDSNLLRNR